MKKYQMNLKDRSGCIRTGYQETVEAETPEEAIREFWHWLASAENMEVEDEEIDCVEIDWEAEKVFELTNNSGETYKFREENGEAQIFAQGAFGYEWMDATVYTLEKCGFDPDCLA